MSWMIFSVVGAMFTGLIGIAYYSQQELTLSNPETIFLELGKILFTHTYYWIFISRNFSSDYEYNLLSVTRYF